MMTTETQNETINEYSKELISDGKNIAIIAYLTLIGLIIAFVMNSDKKNKFATYHIRQVLGLAVCGLGLFVVSWIPFLGWIVSLFGGLFLVVLWFSGIMNALNGRAKAVPVLGKKFEEWFKNV